MTSLEQTGDDKMNNVNYGKIYGTKHPYKIKGRGIRHKVNKEVYLLYKRHQIQFKNVKMFFKRSNSKNGIICHRKGRLK